MKKNSLLFLSILFIIILCSCGDKYDCPVTSTISPDGLIQINFILKDGIPLYSIKYNNTILLDNSKLGFKFQNATDMETNFKIVNIVKKVIDDRWKPIFGTVDHIRNHCNQMTIVLEEKTALQRKMTLVFRTYNDGIAFRYIIPKQKNLNKVNIMSEETEFNFVKNHECWWIPANYDSYEQEYNTTSLAKMDSVNTPVTMKTDQGLYLSIHEADLTNYAGMTLVPNPNKKFGLQCDLVPWADGVKVKCQTPIISPWRTIQITPKAGDLLTSNLILNLNEPCKLDDTSWIKPMKYIGIWWGLHIGRDSWIAGDKHGATTKEAKRYIDFANKNSFNGLLIEGWNTGWESWGEDDNFDYVTPYEDYDLQEVTDYARKKNVEIIGHLETGGSVPKFESQIDSAFTLFKKLGIDAIKTGYAGKIRPVGEHHHGQYMVNHYRSVVKKAAKYKIMVNAHEPIKATGIRRKYPNMLTREGARGMEYNAWSKGNLPEHTTIIPFTRLLGGPMDYTPGIFDLTFNNYKKEYRVWTTKAKQLAYYVLLYSPMQMAADLLVNYEDDPAFKFIQDVPVTWNETKVLEAEIGDYLIMARRYGDEWFLGGITDEYPRSFEIKLDFLEANKKYIAEIYSDAIDTDMLKNPGSIDITKCIAYKHYTLQASLSTSGGIAVRFRPFDNKTNNNFVDLSYFNKYSKDKIKVYNKLEIYKR